LKERIIAIVAVALVSTVCVIGTPPAGAAVPGSIKGRVFVKPAGQPQRPCTQPAAWAQSEDSTIWRFVGGDSDGRFVIPDLPSEHDYYIFHHCNEWVDGGPWWVGEIFRDKPGGDHAHAELVTVLDTGQPTTQINATLAPGAALSGRLTDGQDRPLPGSDQECQAVVSVWKPPSGPTTNHPDGHPDGLPIGFGWCVGAGGNYTFHNTFPGANRVEFYSFNPRFRNEWYHNKLDIHSAKTITIPVGTMVTGLNEQLARLPATTSTAAASFDSLGQGGANGIAAGTQVAILPDGRLVPLR
jgi:hypothetical protein